MEYIKLNNGVEMPMLGYGVYQISQQECERCVEDALSVGYRSIDTAQAYNNEEAVGRAIAKSGIARRDLFLTTKVWISNAGYEKTKQSVSVSLDKLQTDYIDLLLIHQPFGDVYGSWRAMEELLAAGRVRAIGVSNFQPDRLVDLVLNNKVAPAVNQLETHPFCQQKETQTLLQSYGIQLESWAPFAEGRNQLFNNALLKEIGNKYGKTVGQVVLRWLIERKVVVIPKSVHKERMAENFNVFDFRLSAQEMEKIALLDQGKSLFLDHRDPQTVKWLCHLH